ncbi:MAG: Protein translocase subunit SecD [uncultured Solirubrobacteraceae bacterium]|uniref:Multifunctional fusion protein n=1 Tax=uncultured Solirubrobacteraceae bacterium TaxID=1162706 RepID=A0A6J4RME1_9ACTN|nr:MAG: Protein translocase subunit SecD [uncultured Solirubrobacteraceae bacterium]
MTDRRRNILILVLVGALLAAAAVTLATKPTRLGLDLKGGVELVYQAKPTNTTKVTSESVTRAIDIMRQRVDALGVAEPEIQNSNGDQIVVSLPNVTNAEEAARVVGTTAQLQFYDWEKNVLGKDCKPAPTDFSVTGGPSAGRQGGLKLYDAVARAKRCPPLTDLNSATGTKYYLVDDEQRKVIAGPEESEQTLRDSEAAKGAPKDARVVEVNEGTVLVQAESINPNADASDPGPDSWYVLRDDVALAGTDIKNPEQNFSNGPGGGGPNVTFEFTGKGAKKWQEVTREIAQRGQSFVVTADGQTVSDTQSRAQHFAIVLDDQLVSVPFIDFAQNPDGIDGSAGSEISGGFTTKSAQALANQLKYGALPIALEPISQSQVSATLGQEALDQGLVAAGVGFLVVALFLLVFYRVLGVLAVGALLIYAVYLFALIKLIPVTLTLPGLAGLVLTIGVCADANIVIFERVKEEVFAGRSIASAIGLGYRKGLSTIIDANVVTLLTAFILFILSTAGVRGFALTLGLGVIVTLFSAVLATQALLGVTGANALKNPRLVGARTHGTKRRFDFNGATKYMFTLSGVILLAGALAIATKGITFGIDFESGTRIQAAFAQPVTEDQVREVLAREGTASADVQRVTGSELGPNTVQISTGELTPTRVNEVNQALVKEFGDTRGAPQVQSVGPTFGQSVARSAVIAVIVSLLLIAVYIALRFEWKYAATTAISLLHDLLLVAGLYAVTGREVTSATVAALLTVLGFSLYDTIIVNDRLRENVPRMPRAAFSQISNRSMNEVVVRSISTVTCASLPIVALYFFGGETLQDFAFALLVGTVSGGYSSIFISSPVLTQWKEREPVFRRRREALVAQLGHVPPFADTKLDVNAEVKQAPRPRLTAPESPERAVPKAEFDQMVRELHADAAPTQVAERETEVVPTGSRRREPDRPAVADTPPPVRDSAADALPEDTVMKDTRPKPKRNKKHGRPR